MCAIKSLKNDHLTLNFHWKSPWCWERLRTEGERVSEDEMGSITDAMTMNLGKLREIGRHKEACRGAVHGVTVRHDWAAEQQQP